MPGGVARSFSPCGARAAVGPVPGGAAGAGGSSQVDAQVAVGPAPAGVPVGGRPAPDEGDSWEVDGDGSGMFDASASRTPQEPMGSDEEVHEEPEEYRKLVAGRSPTAAQRREHEEQNHAVFRDWCPVCLKSRGQGTQHRKKKRDQQRKEEEGPRICSDYFFMSTQEGSAPMLAVKFSRSKRVGATALPAKGVTEFGVKWLARWIQQRGVQRFINFGDNEPALVALREAAAQALPGVESIPGGCPVGDHQANGEIESGVRELKRQMRAIRFSLEEKLGIMLASDDPVLSWIPTFAGDTIAHYRKGADGKTPHERETARKWSRGALEFGERCYIKEAAERIGRPKRDWEPRLVEVRYMGHHARTGSIIGLSPEGVKIGSGVRRMPISERWNADGWHDLRGLPWDMKPGQREAPQSFADDVPPQEPHRMEAKPAEPKIETRDFYIKKADLEKYGYTPDCKGCRAMQQRGNNKGYPHTQQCRARIVEAVRKDDEDRVKRFEERMFTEFERVHLETEESDRKRHKKDDTRRCGAREAAVGPAPDGSAGGAGGTATTAHATSSGSSSSAHTIPVVVDGSSSSIPRAAVGPAPGGLAGSVPSVGQASGGTGPVSMEAERPSKRGSVVVEPPQDRENEPSKRMKAMHGDGVRIVLPTAVPRSGVEDVEDANANAGDISHVSDSVDAVCSLTFDPGGDDVIRLSRGKRELIDLASISVRSCYRRHDVEISDQEIENVAALQVQLAGAHLVELFSPARFTPEATRFGLRPGFAVDLSEAKPYGPEKGQMWGLTRDRDVEQLDEVLDFERPALLVGSPPCDPFSVLRRIGAHREDPERRARRRAIGERHLHTSVRFYRKQHEEGRYFLHEHPDGADSWHDPEVLALQSLPGVYTVNGPMCKWDLELEDPRRGTGLIYKRTRWLTNCPALANVLDTRCTNEAGGPYHAHLSLIGGGLARKAAKYPIKLVRAVLKALREQLLADGELNEVMLENAGPVPSQPTFAGPGFEDHYEDLIKHYDDISGEELPTDLVRKAREEEIRWCDSIGLFDKVPREVAQSSGVTPVPVRWVDVNKGDRHSWQVRSRLVGKELKAKTKGNLLAHELFSAMPPWEMIKALLSMLVTENSEELELGIFDISRAHFMPACKRELYIELPPEAVGPNDGDVVGRLRRNMYGFRDAANGWLEDWQKLLSDHGYRVGTANGALFHNPEQRARGGVHGDDFYVLGPRAAIDHISGVLTSKYSVRLDNRLGFSDHCKRAGTILNRVVELSEPNGMSN